MENGIFKQLQSKSKNLYNRIKRNIEAPKKKREFLKRSTQFYSQFVNPGDLSFDVGANVGNRIDPMLKIGARVVAVEPQEKCYKYLQSKFGSKIQLVTKGLGESEGTMSFFVSNASTISSFSKEWIDAVKEDRFKNYQWEAVENVEITTLDNVIQQFGRPKFIKIDVEGFELEVLKGLSQPIGCISYEYTIPEQTEKAINCMKRIHEINPDIECNYSVGETMELAMNKWLSFDEMISFMTTKSFIDTSFGDIYVRTKGLS